MAALCVTCLQDASNKAKPGIIPCIGCKQMFCTQHVVFHRQELTNELNLVIGERNELQDLFDHQKDLPDTTFHMDIIDEWVKKTIAQVYQVAGNARQRLLSIVQEQKERIKDKFDELSKQLNDMRENDNFFEEDIANMKDKCNHIKAIVKKVDTNINTADVYHFLDEAITFQTTEQTTTEVLSSVENILKHQKPDKQITVPHDGLLCVGGSLALIRNRMNYTVVDLDNNSMRSISLEIPSNKICCWSSYHNAYFSTKHTCNVNVRSNNAQYRRNTIEFISILNKNQKCAIITDSDGTIVKMACFDDHLLTVCINIRDEQVIEEWHITNANVDEGELSFKLASRWSSPLSCSTNESIQRIAFNDEHVVLAIKNSNISPQNRLEFRTRGMLVLRQIALDENVDYVSMSLVSVRDGWILGQKKNPNESRHYIFIDKNFHEHEQKFLFTENIEHIAFVKQACCKPILVLYQKRNGAKLSTDINRKLLFYDYEIQEPKQVNVTPKKL